MLELCIHTAEKNTQGKYSFKQSFKTIILKWDSQNKKSFSVLNQKESCYFYNQILVDEEEENVVFIRIENNRDFINMLFKIVVSIVEPVEVTSENEFMKVNNFEKRHLFTLVKHSGDYELGEKEFACDSKMGKNMFECDNDPLRGKFKFKNGEISIEHLFKTVVSFPYKVESHKTHDPSYKRRGLKINITYKDENETKETRDKVQKQISYQTLEVDNYYKEDILDESKGCIESLKKLIDTVDREGLSPGLYQQILCMFYWVRMTDYNWTISNLEGLVHHLGVVNRNEGLDYLAEELKFKKENNKSIEKL